MESREPLLLRLLAKSRVVFGLALLAAAAGFLVALSFGSMAESLSGRRPIVLGWRTAQFFFNYQDLGFIKRGLIGSLIHPFPALQTRTGLLGLSALFLVAVAAAFSRLFGACTRQAPARTAALLAGLGLLMPSFFLRFGFDYGRYDGVNLALALAGLGLIQRGRLAWAAVLCALSVLVHEAFIVLQFPLLLAYALSRAGPGWRRVAWQLAALPLAVTVLVFAFGSYRPGAESLAAYFGHNRAYLALDGQVNLDAIAIPTRGFFENFHYNAEMFRQKRALLHIPIVAAWFAVFLACYDRFHRRNGLPRDWLYFSAFSPLLLGLIAWDYYRWFALASVNLLLVLLLRTRNLAEAGRSPVLDFDLSTKVILASFLLGPISNSTSFPLAFTLLGKILPGLQW